MHFANKKKDGSEVLLIMQQLRDNKPSLSTVILEHCTKTTQSRTMSKQFPVRSDVYALVYLSDVPFPEVSQFFNSCWIGLLYGSYSVGVNEVTLLV